MAEFEQFASTMSELNEQSMTVLRRSSTQPPTWHPTRPSHYTYTHVNCDVAEMLIICWKTFSFQPSCCHWDSFTI